MVLRCEEEEVNVKEEEEVWVRQCQSWQRSASARALSAGKLRLSE